MSVEYPGQPLDDDNELEDDRENDLDTPSHHHPPFDFQARFQGWMELYAPLGQYEAYLNSHRQWFYRCAHPMAAEPIGENGYILVIGRYGSFGYEVEPKIGLNLLPAEEGVYRIQTIPVPDQPFLNYEVDFQAEKALKAAIAQPETDQDLIDLGVSQYTVVDWQLDLSVKVYFPRFIYRLPHGLIQRTGDRILAEIVKQVSYRLTAKVQDDFHETIGLTFGKRWRRQRCHSARLNHPGDQGLDPTPDGIASPAPEWPANSELPPTQER